jgi:hypothetical protein
MYDSVQWDVVKWDFQQEICICSEVCKTAQNMPGKCVESKKLQNCHSTQLHDASSFCNFHDLTQHIIHSQFIPFHTILPTHVDNNERIIQRLQM